MTEHSTDILIADGVKKLVRRWEHYTAKEGRKVTQKTKKCGNFSDVPRLMEPPVLRPAFYFRSFILRKEAPHAGKQVPFFHPNGRGDGKLTDGPSKQQLEVKAKTLGLKDGAFLLCSANYC